MATYSRLTNKLLALSNSDDYEEAKKEWRITGEVWKESSSERTRSHVSGHPNSCLCGHDIVYHFEIENTEMELKKLLVQLVLTIGWFFDTWKKS